MSQKLQALLAEYGKTALIVYFALFFLVLAGFVAALKLGIAPQGNSGRVGIWIAAWLATKLTLPFRLAATVVVTPFVSKIWLRVKGDAHSNP